MPHAILREIPSVLQSQRLILRCPQAGDGALVHLAIVESLVALRQFPASLPWAMREQSIESSEIFCRTAHADFLAGKGFAYLVLDKTDSKLIGCAGLHRPDWDMSQIEIGYWCRSSQTGHGYISEAVRTLTDIALHHLPITRVVLVTDEHNHPSMAVAHRTGFTLESTLPSVIPIPDSNLRTDIRRYSYVYHGGLPP
ncbi:GNAT family N-acetyltransferase [Curvibacter sp. CHRR-16]|uniref:GNAT family N-acetyltransferase n=1 Tax=Curvibacter sp. CHRR-16 TaxID=2835872 RepID=UPI001BDAB866|nr:GNAT family N-acetyltransferase [Curvibacter sp. CHRR-16]MBT0570922.1 GNAT family N-acetyltransferase [Curvibacter sp. CHRR-16]